jgi:hypothetical protein
VSSVESVSEVETLKQRKKKIGRFTLYVHRPQFKYILKPAVGGGSKFELVFDSGDRLRSHLTLVQLLLFPYSPVYDAPHSSVGGIASFGHIPPDLIKQERSYYYAGETTHSLKLLLWVQLCHCSLYSPLIIIGTASIQVHMWLS